MSKRWIPLAAGIAGVILLIFIIIQFIQPPAAEPVNSPIAVETPEAEVQTALETNQVPAVPAISDQETVEAADTDEAITESEEQVAELSVAVEGDLTGDGQSDTVWVSFSIGAHTTLSTYTVSVSSEGKLEAVEGSAEMANVESVEIADGKLLLTGGLIGSAGAGLWQREFTDTYTIVDQVIVPIDRAFAEAPTAYHRLLDGLWAEAYGHTERALQSYAEATTTKVDSYEEYGFEWDGEWMEGGVDPVREAEFERIVQQFAQMRHKLLTNLSQQNTPEAACAAAKQEAGYVDAWLPYLNAPAGYANYTWRADTVCYTIDQLEL